MAVVQIGFHVTDRCQLDCQHCLRDPAQAPRDLPLALFRKVLAEAKRVYHCEQVALTGGEPTLHPDFEGLLDAIVEHGYGWHLVTNGKRFARLLDLLKESPERRTRLTAVNLSLDGATEPTHDAIRGAGSFREVMLAATLCTAHQIPFVLQMAVNAKNQHEIEAMGLLASQLGAKRASFAMLQATGTHHDHALYLSPRSWQNVQDRIERLMETLKLPVGMPEGFPHPQPFHTCEPFASTQLHVDLEGRLNLCCQHSGIPSTTADSDVAGDLNEMSLVEAHGKLLGIIHKTQADKLVRLSKGPPSEWERFPCNDCLKHFGKPHWSDEGPAGPVALRERWKGAWAEKNSLPIVR